MSRFEIKLLSKMISLKLKPRADGPFKVLKRIGENAYKIELPAEYEVSDT